MYVGPTNVAQITHPSFVRELNGASDDWLKYCWNNCDQDIKTTVIKTLKQLWSKTLKQLWSDIKTTVIKTLKAGINIKHFGLLALWGQWLMEPTGPTGKVICMNHWPWVLADHSHIVMHLISMLYTFYTQVPMSCNFHKMVCNVNDEYRYSVENWLHYGCGRFNQFV